MPITAHIRWLCGMIVMPGPQTTLRMVNFAELWRFCTPARAGAPSLAMTAAGVETARATISRTDLCAGSRLTASWQSAMNRSRSNTAAPPIQLCGRFRGGRGAMSFLMKVIGSIEFEHQVAIDSRLVTWRIFGVDTGRHALDHGARIGAVEIGDRIAVSSRLV